jgi:hypothetical protein
MADGLTVQFEDGARVAAALKVAPLAMKAELRKSNAATARLVRSGTRSAAAAGTRQQARMAGGIGSTSNSTSSTLTLRNTAGAPGAMGAFLGSKRYKQFPPPVGNTWTVGGPGGPYVINPYIEAHEAEIETVFLQGQLDAVARGLPRF